MNEHIASDLKPYSIEFNGQRLELHPLKAMWWRDQSMLIVSDVHVGKAGHFAKHGMSVPSKAFQQNCWNLSVLYDRYQPKTVLFLGDLFHSSHNSEWDIFCDFKDNYPKVKSLLVKGNHEILVDEEYSSLGLEVVERWCCGPFSFTHEPMNEPSELYNWSGHIHPSVRLRGNASQSMRLPCFWLGKMQGVLPAFGSLTGTHRVKPLKGDQVFVLAGEQVVRV